MLFGKKIEPIKTSFDNEKFEVAHPYILFVNRMVIHGTYSHGDEKSLYFNYFDENDKSHQIMITRSDELTVYPLQSCTEKNSETYNMYSAMRSMNDLDFSKLLDLKAEPVEEDAPNIKSFYIHDINNKLRLDEIFYPLYVKTEYGWRINGDIITKLKESDIKSWEVGFGYGGNSGGCTKGIFKSNEISLAPRNTMLCADRKINSDTEMSIEIDIDWKSIRYAYIKVR